MSRQLGESRGATPTQLRFAKLHPGVPGDATGFPAAVRMLFAGQNRGKLLVRP